MPEIIVKLGERIIHRYFFDKDVLSVGRARDNDVVIENLSVSRNHARIKKEDGKYFLTDMNSANGTLVNGVRITKTEIFHNDQITVGKHLLLFINQDAAAAAGTATSEKRTGDEAPIASGEMGVLVVSKGKQAGQEFKVQKSETYIGRASENDIRIHDWFVSKRHAVVTREGAGFKLKDLDSWRGTTVNGTSIREVDLKDGDEIVFGTTVLNFKVVNAEEYISAHPLPSSDQVLKFEQDENWGTDSSARRLIPPEAPSEPTSKTNAPLPHAPEHPTSDDIAVPAPPEDEGTSVPAGDDEYAPLTDEELEALDNEPDHFELDRDEEEENRRLSWEMLEAEKMFQLGERDSEDVSLVEDDDELSAEENAAIDREAALEGLAERPDASTDLDAEDRDEEEALHLDALDESSELGRTPVMVHEPAVEKPSGDHIDEAKSKEIQLWEKALKNKSIVIRKNAARELKKLTGKDYDWKSDPTGA